MKLPVGISLALLLFISGCGNDLEKRAQQGSSSEVPTQVNQKGYYYDHLARCENEMDLPTQFDKLCDLLYLSAFESSSENRSKKVGDTSNYLLIEEHLSIYDSVTKSPKYAIDLIDRLLILDNSEDLELHYLKGRILYSIGQHDAAIENFNQVLKLKPKFHEVSFLLSVIYTKRGIDIETGKLINQEAVDQAFVHIDKAIKNGFHPSYFWVKAYLLWRKEQHKKSISYLEKYLKYQPNDTYYWEELGRRYFDVDDYDNSLDISTKLLNANVNSLPAWKLRCDSLSALEKLQDTYQCVKQTLNLVKTGSKSELEYLERELELSKKLNKSFNSKSWLKLANFYFEDQKYQEAIKAYQEFLQVTTSKDIDYEIRERLADSYFQTGNYTEAASTYISIIKNYANVRYSVERDSDHHYLESLETIASYFSDNDKLEDALDINQFLLSFRPNDNELRLKVIRLHAQLGNEQEIVTAYKSLIQSNPNHSVVEKLPYLANTLKQNQGEKALITFYQEILEFYNPYLGLRDPDPPPELSANIPNSQKAWSFYCSELETLGSAYENLLSKCYDELLDLGLYKYNPKKPTIFANRIDLHMQERYGKNWRTTYPLERHIEYHDKGLGSLVD